MEPTFKAGQKIFASSLLHTRLNDVVSYKADPSPYDTVRESYISIGRIVGVAGDKIAIKKGSLYRNDARVDDTLALCYSFSLKNEALSFSPSSYDLKHKIFSFPGRPSILNFSYHELQHYGISGKCSRNYETPNGMIQPALFGSDADNQWSNDEFGPITIPPGKLFLMGDNRSNSADSRVRGPVAEERIIAKIIY